MVAAITVMFIVSWAPYFVVQATRLLSLNMCKSPAVRVAHTITAELGALSAGVNFIIYAYINRDFRSVVQQSAPQGAWKLQR
jgi:uncharacterized membrane protein